MPQLASVCLEVLGTAQYFAAQFRENAMRLSVLYFALVLCSFAVPATGLSQEGMPQGVPSQSVLVNYNAAMPAQAYGGAYCPPQGHHGMFQHHHQSNLPGYAYPAYAPHPNFGAMDYPKTHAPAAWPYSGPFHPYPQIPPGWKKVALEWDDGYWYLDFKSARKPKHH
ncbi:hypothetical protein DTL21_04140 [Bremerella cremea]|uniref:Uncharacterized protein n=1 Tax=Blastopirellula marina TaxID=124 RepID=A0A2S8FYC1_9BACT|nr:MULTISPECIES: hypothetical protein [Pirellulaceae]PQO37153.1 hypothetical protein C5Y83_04140 [Blastopirellula marina]RCS49540.1 hypothetical protein DTL21_04140 [Bremerella cremea]